MASLRHSSSHGRPLPLRVVWFFVFVLRFLWALILANLVLARSVLFERRENLAPGFITYSTVGLSTFEVILLSHSITLTPGTTTVEIAGDFSHLVVHAFDAREPDSVISDIRVQLEQAILRWTR